MIVDALLHLPVGGRAVFSLLGQQHLLEDDTARGVQMVERALVAPVIVIPGLFHKHGRELWLGGLLGLAASVRELDPEFLFLGHDDHGRPKG